MKPIILCIYQDVRLRDNPALYHATQTGKPIITVYIHENDDVSNKYYGSAQKLRMRQALLDFQKNLHELYQSPLIFKSGNRLQILQELIQTTSADTVYWNRRYLPHHIAFDTKVKTTLKAQNINVKSFKSNLLFEPHEIKNLAGDYYKVYSPFKKACLKLGIDTQTLPKPEKIIFYSYTITSLSIDDLYPIPTNPDWGSKILTHWDLSEEGALKRLDNFIKNGLEGYKEKRNFPALNQHVSELSPYLAQGLISPRQIMHTISFVPDNKDKEHYISEILWREFSYYLIYHAPHMLEGNFRPEWDNFSWRWEEKDKQNFKKWCRGKTGVPIIDAAMKQLWETGYMHNRCRMIVASYLIKHLLINWKYGEEWFKDTLIDYDTANNISGWQWVAGSGADAAPYFRIFNPVLQSKKFDPDAIYIRKFYPKLKQASNDMLHDAGEKYSDIVTLYNYYPPLIDHETGRKRALDIYKKMSSID